MGLYGAYLEHSFEGRRLRSQDQFVSVHCSVTSFDHNIAADRVIKESCYVAAQCTTQGITDSCLRHINLQVDCVLACEHDFDLKMTVKPVMLLYTRSATDRLT